MAENDTVDLLANLQRSVDAVKARVALTKTLLSARWPDGASDGFPTRKIAEMLADAVLASDWLATHAPSDLAALLVENERLRARADAAEAALEAGDACGAVGCRALAERDEAIAALERVRDRDWLADVLASRCSKSGDNMSHVLCGELVHRQHHDEADVIIAALGGAHPTPSDGSGADG